LIFPDAFRETTGHWPTLQCGRIPQDRFETWFSVDVALRRGLRGLPAGGSLARLLAEKRDHPRPTSLWNWLCS
jgi:hypothetical protein